MMFLLAAALLTPTAPLLSQGGTMQGTLQAVSPALGQYTEQSLLGDVSNRPGLSKRDRSVVTLAALVSRNQTIELLRYLNLALDNGVKPAEISELITHLAFYTGWANAVGAATAAKDVFEARKMVPINCHPRRPSRCLWMKRPKLSVPPASANNSVQCSLAWCGTPPRCYSRICGCAPILRRVTGALYGERVDCHRTGPANSLPSQSRDG